MILLGNLWSLAAWALIIYVVVGLVAEWRRGGAE